MNEVLKVISERRSVRKFGEGQLADADLQAILEAGLQAPSGHNDQSWFFSVVQDKELIKALSDGSKQEMQKIPLDWIAELGKNEKYNIYYNAPTIVLVATKKGAVSPIPDASAAIQNMLLAATSLGLASCWIGFTKFYFNSLERNAQVGIPVDYEVQYGVALGYFPKEQKLNPPARKYQKYYQIIK